MKISWVGTNTNQNCGTKILLSAAEAADAEAEAERLVEVEGALLLDIVVGEGAPVLELLHGEAEEKPLLIRRNSLLVLNLCLDVLDRIGRLHLEGDGLAGERPKYVKDVDKDLHAASESLDEV